MPEDAYLIEQARRCRRLARLAKPREAKILRDMADEYEARAHNPMPP